MHAAAAMVAPAVLIESYFPCCIELLSGKVHAVGAVACR
jgi:hypothetical protein